MALQRTRSELSALLLQRIPDNPLHAITPAAVRAELLDMIASALNLADDGLPNATPGVASFGTTTGSPFDSPALTAALNRGPNNRPDLRKGVRYLTVAESTAGGGGDSLEALAAAGVCLFTEATVEFYRPDPAGPTTRGQVLVAEYDGSATPALLGFRDASFTGLPLPLHWVPQQERRDALPYALAPAGYSFATAQFVSAFVPDASTEQFFHPLADGPQPVGPTSKDGDAHWAPVARQDVPIPPGGISQTQFDALEVRVENLEGANPGAAIPLSGTTTGHPVTGPIQFLDEANSQLVQMDTFDQLSFRFLDAGSGDEMGSVEFGTAITRLSNQLSIRNTANNVGVFLACSATGELLVNGQPVGGSSTSLQIRTTNGLRVAQVAVTERFTVGAANLFENASGVVYQLNTRATNASAWTPGTDLSAAQVTAAIAALTDAQLAVGQELEIETTPVQPADPARVILALS